MEIFRIQVAEAFSVHGVIIPIAHTDENRIGGIVSCIFSKKYGGDRYLPIPVIEKLLVRADHDFLHVFLWGTVIMIDLDAEKDLVMITSLAGC